MESLQLKGCFTALVTPFGQDGELDLPALRRLAEWQIESGINGIVPCGTTGESVTLSMDEYRSVIETVADVAAGRVPVIAGAGGNDTAKTIKLAKLAIESGAEALLSVSPYYNKPSPKGLVAHYSAIAEAVDVPLILYNVPGRTSSNMQAETTLQLAEVSTIIGIKEASGDLAQIMEICRCRPDGFAVVSGDDALALPIIACGGDGVISVVSNEIPAEFTALIQAALQGDLGRARQIQNKYLPLMHCNFIEANPIPVKTALALMGRLEEIFRLPLTTMDPANREQLNTELKTAGLI